MTFLLALRLNSTGEMDYSSRKGKALGPDTMWNESYEKELMTVARSTVSRGQEVV